MVGDGEWGRRRQRPRDETWPLRVFPKDFLQLSLRPKVSSDGEFLNGLIIHVVRALIQTLP